MRWLVSVGVVLLASCSTVDNPAFCDENADCKNGFVCNLDTNGCEAQQQPMDDAGVDASNSCTLDDECASGVCRDDSTCEDAANILYVSPDGISAGMCPADGRCDLVYALSIVSPQVSTIRLANGSYDIASDLEVDETVTLVGGRAAVLKRSSPGAVISAVGPVGAEPTLVLRGMTSNKGIECNRATVRLQRVMFDNPPPEATPWIDTLDCRLVIEQSELRDSPTSAISGEYTDLAMVDSKISGSGIDVVGVGDGIAINRGRLGSVGISIERSTIELNLGMGLKLSNLTSFRLERSTIINNRAGGVSAVDTSYDVTNNMIVLNGAQVSPVEFGGMRLAGSGRAIHNTITQNRAPPDALYAGGLYCDNGTASNNIIVDNERGNEELPYAQVRGTCNFAGSIVDPSSNAAVFVDPFAGDFHLASSSPAVNAGGTPQVGIDFDGEPRSDGAADLGADERP
ncbi:MAG: right-handed parallel beta-helix repeat-containing protein [Kofleriaceae bacterium]